jgi:hypothetical protein
MGKGGLISVLELKVSGLIGIELKVECSATDVLHTV